MHQLPSAAKTGLRIRTLIVDDEPPAREKVRFLLQREPDFDIIGECADGSSAIDAIRREKPDLVFLDIQMPGADGFEVIQAVGIDAIPAVIFVTAYDQHALRAFEYHALDYLLKPYALSRFQEALSRAKIQILAGTDPIFRRQLLSMLGNIRDEGHYLERLVVKSAGRVVFLSVHEIDWIEAAGNYAALHVGSASHLIRETMNELESRLDPAHFVRVHRSTIVGIDRIRELRPILHGDYALFLKSGTRLTLSRHYHDRIPALVAVS